MYPGRVMYSQEGRVGAALAAIAGGVLVRGSTFAEITVAYLPNCTAFEAIAIGASHLVLDNYWFPPSPPPLPLPQQKGTGTRYRIVFMFWVRNVAIVIAPFCLLFYMNIAIVRKLRSQYRSHQCKPFPSSPPFASSSLNLRPLVVPSLVRQGWNRTVDPFWFVN